MTINDEPRTLARAAGRESILLRPLLGIAILGAVSAAALQANIGDGEESTGASVAQTGIPEIVVQPPDIVEPDWVVDFDKIPPFVLPEPPALEPPPITAVASWRVPS